MNDEKSTDRVCDECETDWGLILDYLSKAMHKEKINYCPQCGKQLIDD